MDELFFPPEPLQPSSEAHPSSYALWTKLSFLGGESSSRTLKLITHLLLWSR